MAVVIWLASSSNAYAYIDPGYGSLLWQLLVASIFGALFYARGIIFNIKNWLKGDRDGRKKAPKED